MSEPRSELGRITLSVLFIGGLIVGALWILKPFLPAFVWATMLVVTTWPLLLKLQRAVGGRRWLATLLMTLAVLAVVLVPLILAINAVVAHADGFAAAIERLSSEPLPPPPDWVAGLPLVGERLAAGWAQLVAPGSADLVARLQPHLRDVARWVAGQAGGVAVLLLHFLLVLILSAVLYAGGEGWARWMRAFGRRLAPIQGERMVTLAGQAIRGVALGVVVTAVLQTLLAGLGLAVAGVPFAPVLTALIFALCLAQLGPLLVLLPVVAWAFAKLGTGWGIGLLVWSLAVGLMDNLLRPLLIKRGADLPLLLIFTGVVGGLVAFGVIGIFVGPVVLAVAYTLLDDWVKSGT